MSLRECIINAEKDGDITSDQARIARELFDDLEAEYQGQMGKGAASAKAAQDTYDVLKREALESKRRKLLQVQNWQTIKLNLDQYRNIRGERDIGKAALALFDADVKSNFSSVVQREAAVEQAATAKLYDVLATFRRNLVGEVRNKAKLEQLVREVFEPGSTGSLAAKEMAMAWSTAADYLRKRFNAAGGRIPKRVDWGMPQIHDMLAVRKASYKDWSTFIRPLLNVEKMVDETTGLPFNQNSLEVALTNVYETISSGGANKILPGNRGQGSSLANRRVDHRFLVFKDADSWIAYQNKFGNANSFDTMFGHIKSMSRDIALLEILGPNPKATVRFVQDTIKKEAGLSKDAAAENAANISVNKINELYNAVTGTSNAPIDSRLGNTFAGLRQILQSAQLGSAAISAITDLNFQRIAREMNGLPQTSTINQYLEQLNPLTIEEKGKIAIRLGLIAEGWTSLAAAQMRYVGDISGPEVTRRIADFTMRASFLSAFTNAGRWSFGMSYLGTLADNVGRGFDDLDPPLRGAMERYGIDAQRWDIMRSTPLYEHKGAEFLRAEDIEARTDIDPTLARSLATRMMEMINTETNYAVPTSSLRGRLAFTGETRPGTVAGELVRSFVMYKNFAVSVLNTHIMRGMLQPGAKGKGKYYAGLVISTTLMGALALQLKEISKGRDPMPMTGAKFWGAAFMQGGGAGIYGDFLFGGINRYGSNLSSTVAGPVVGFADDVYDLTVGNLAPAALGEDTDFASDLIEFTGRYTPGSSIWYSRLAFERLILDQAQTMADPKARAKVRRIQRRYKRKGQNYWWRPGAIVPDRLPDVSNVMEEAP